MSENAFMKATGTNNIGKMRSGKLSISEGTISKICNSLGVSYSWLKYGSGSMNGNMVIQLGETHQKIEESINEAFKHGIPMAQLINAGNVGDNSQNITTGTERAKEREEESFKDKNAQLIQIINAQNETIKSKDSEIRLLRKIFLLITESKYNIIIYKDYEEGSICVNVSIRRRTFVLWMRNWQQYKPKRQQPVP